MMKESLKQESSGYINVRNKRRISIIGTHHCSFSLVPDVLASVVREDNKIKRVDMEIHSYDLQI